MLILLVVLWLLGVLARDDSNKDHQYEIQHISSCPAVGYYFRRAAAPNALGGRCLLCFCQGDGTAVCWPRQNDKCDVAHYQHGVGKKDTRIRRSPLGLSDIFFRDAARDLFNKQSPEVCKPYESSFSEGCPPADWCTGCTVCDCDANGRWDCHILSFCPDKKDKNKWKTSKKRLREGTPRRTTPAKPKIPSRTNKNVPKRTPAPRKPVVNKNKQVKTKENTAKAKQQKMNTKPIKPVNANGNKNIQKRSGASPKPLIIKKDGISKKPVVINTQSLPVLNASYTDKITQDVYKKVVSAMQRILEKQIIARQPKPTTKTVPTRSMAKRSAKNIQNTKTIRKKVENKWKPPTNKRKYTKPVGPKNNNRRNAKKIPKKPVKINKKPVTTRKPMRTARKNVRRNKREIVYNNITETIIVENSSYTNMEVPVSSSSIFTSTENGTETNITTANDYYKYLMQTTMFSNVTENPEQYQIVYALQNNNSTNYNTTHMQTTMFSNSTEKSDQYQIVYALENNSSMNYNTTRIHKKRDKEKHFDEIQAIVLNSSGYENNTNKSGDKLLVESAVPDFNDLKFNNWPQIKMIKNSLLIKKLKTLKNKRNGTNISKPKNPLTRDREELITLKNRVKAKDITRVVSLSLKKYNRSKIINTISCNNNNSSKENVGIFRERIYNKISNLQNVLKKMLIEFRKTNTTKVKPKPRRFNITKYIKKFFNKVFKRYRYKGKKNIKDQTEFNNHVIDTICESFSDCDMSQKDNKLLKSKIVQLNTESHTIIRTIKIIKGLLHLLDVPTKNKILENKQFNNGRLKSNLKEDINKLNNVLKDKYISSNTPLTSTQMTQIRYIKNNTQVFVHSVSRFANTLNEIINILTKKHNTEGNDKHVYKTAKRSYDYNRNLKNDTAKDLSKLKKMLIKYNMIQNMFVRKMYDVLSKFEKVNENKTKPIENNETKENKATTANIEHFSRNIINNLRKLRNLAEMLNSRRKKRATLHDDDAIEYLLTLMEYLLKQNYPLDAAPVNDGIDLLIEAIRTAPDIKPIKKKVLQSMPANIRISRTTEPVPFDVSRENSSSGSRRVSGDSTDNDTKTETKESSYQEKEGDDDHLNYHSGKNIFDMESPVNTEVNYYKGEPIRPNKIVDTTVIPGPYGIFGNVDDITEHNNFDKFESLAKANAKKFEVYNGDLEEEDTEVTSSTLPADLDTDIDSTVTVTVPLETTEFKLANIKAKQYNINSVDVSGNSEGDKRLGLDWLDEGYDENKEIRQTKVKAPPRTEAPLITTSKTYHVDNVSTLTKEVSDEEERKRKSKINVADVMFKKQMDLLNSLDYGTERSDADDAESKEGDEREPGDAFPSYFV